MMLLGLVVLVLVLAVVVSLNRRSTADAHPARSAGPAGISSPDASSPDAGVDVAARLERWTQAGLLTPDEAAAIAAFERTAPAPLAAPVAAPVSGPVAAPVAASAPAPAPAPRQRGTASRIPSVAEALGYLGGVLGLAGLVLLLSRAWEDMGVGGRLAVSGLAAVAAIVGGALVHEHEDPALARLRWFLWLIGTAAAGVVAFVVADEVVQPDQTETTTFLVAATVAVVSGVLWRWRDRPVQQATALGGLVVSAGALVAIWAEPALVGLTVWLVGAVLVGAGVLRWTPLHPLTAAVGALAVTVGAITVAEDVMALGCPLFVATAVVLLALASSRGDAIDTPTRVILLVIGLMNLWNSLPATIAYFGEEAGVLTGAVLAASGLAVLVVGERRLTRAPELVAAGGALALLGGAAVMGLQSVTVAVIVGLLASVCLVVLGSRPGHLAESLVGAAGLLGFVPWAIAHFFPGEGRVPLMVFVSGLVIVLVAVMIGRHGGLHGPSAGGPLRHGGAH